jgi:hypothetical protein
MSFTESITVEQTILDAAIHIVSAGGKEFAA